MLSLQTERFKKLIFVNNTNMENKKNDEDSLKENISNFLASANVLFERGDFTSSAIIYFKAFFAVLDLLILKETGRTPKDHSERFRILEIKLPNLYSVLDKLYPTYRVSYSSSINKLECIVVRENVERIIKEQKIFKGN